MIDEPCEGSRLKTPSGGCRGRLSRAAPSARRSPTRASTGSVVTRPAADRQRLFRWKCLRLAALAAGSRAILLGQRSVSQSVIARGASARLRRRLGSREDGGRADGGGAGFPRRPSTQSLPCPSSAWRPCSRVYTALRTAQALAGRSPLTRCIAASGCGRLQAESRPASARAKPRRSRPS